MVAKLSSVSTMSAASLETSVPVIPIATPMSAVFKRGASFTPSPVIATVGAAALQRLHDAQFVFRIDARINRNFPHSLRRAPHPTFFQLGAGDGTPVGVMPSSAAMTAAFWDDRR